MPRIASLTRHVRSFPEIAIARIFDAYDLGGGYPHAAARYLKVSVSTLHGWNKRLGIVGMIRARTGHRPGWLGRNRIRRFDPKKRPHRSRAWIDARYA